MDVAQLRDSIAATREVTYLNTGWAGPSPRPVLERIRDMLEREAAAGPASLEMQRLAWETNESARDAVAAFLHADAEEIALTHGTTEGLNVVLYGYPWQPGDELVTCSLEHVALAAPLPILAERFGVVPKVVEVPPDASEDQQLERIGEAIGSKTKLVALSHVQYSCGLRMPITAIAEAAHRAGALLLIDGAQTGGQIDLDVRALGADFYAISGQKWLLGPQGTGACFIAREHTRTINPLFNTHEMADSHPFTGEGGIPMPLLQRFRVASQSPALIAGFGEAVRLMGEIGMEVVEARAGALASRLRSGLAAISGCTLTGPREGSVTCGLVSVALDGWPPPLVVETLWDRWRIAARAVAAPAAIRFSTHVFNTEAEIDRALDAVGALINEGPPQA
ncbi:MAG: L-cysteine/cystine lyase [Chloroflexota bacterium]|jgi:L-cysteine/cystine lyase|nr:L-cysteine/cystine lyase [Chloroflexota bacterium]